MDISGILSNKGLFTVLKPGPAYYDDRLNSYWPEVNPGFFKAGSNSIYYGFDYLYANEARLISGPTSDISTINYQISHTFGPILGAYYTSSTLTGDVYAKSVSTTGWVSRNSAFTPLIYGSCRLRLYHNMDSEGTWSLLSTGSTYKLYKYTIPDEANGFGTKYDPIPLKLVDSYREWKNLGYLEDIVACGVPGLNEWAVGSSGTIVVKRSLTDTAPSGLALCWLAGQASLDYEEIGLSTTEGTPISLGSKTSISDCYIQFPFGGYSPTGYSISPITDLPRLISTLNMPANVELVIRYRPTGVYSTYISTSGVQIVVRPPSRSICTFRYEQSTPKELFPAGRFTNNINAINTLTALPGFLIAVAPGHVLHSSAQGTGNLYGATLLGSKIVSWSSCIDLYLTTSPSKIKIMVLGADDIPIPNVSIELISSTGITVPTGIVITSIEGTAYTEVTKVTSGTGTATLTMNIYNLGVLMDSKQISFNLKNNTALWKKRVPGGLVHIDILPYTVRSGFSNRKQLAVYRTSADGTPSVYANYPLRVFCNKGRLFSYLGNNISLVNNNSGKELLLTNQSTIDAVDKPIILEYEGPSSGEIDTIYCIWSSENGIPSAYGSLVI